MLRIEQLYIDSRTHPLDASFAPEFSWTYQEGSAGRQFSFRLLLATSAPLCQGGKADVYDSGEIQSSGVNYTYDGAPLLSRHAYAVRLIITDEKGEKDEILSFFETTLTEKEWKGQWIGIGASWNGGALAIRKDLPPFEKKKLARARAYVAGLGYNEFYVNGHKQGDALLNPAVSDYRKIVYYDTYDLTSLLTGEGDKLGFLLGYGWYGEKNLLCQIDLDFTDGSQQEIHSTNGDGWWFAPTPITANAIYSGETYDAREEEAFPNGVIQEEYHQPFDPRFFSATLAQASLGKLVPQRIPPIRKHEEIEGRLIQKFSGRDLVYDLRQNIAGVSAIEVQGKRGSTIILRHGESLKEDGHLDQTNLRSASATDRYILRGRGIEHYCPRFTYHGFRYVEVEIEGEAELLSLKGIHLHSDNAPVGSFICSNEKINRLHAMAVLTESNNETGILSDCPQRDERFGWLNDLSTRVYQIPYNFQMDTFFKKVVKDIALAQDEEGRISDTAPYFVGGRPADVTSVSYLLLIREHYRYYGELTFVKEAYPGAKAWVEFLLSHSKNFQMDYSYYGDWVSPDVFPDAHSDGLVISSLFLLWHLEVLSELATILGKKDEEKHYRDLAAQAKKALWEKEGHDDHYAKGTQAEDALALYLDLVPSGNQAKVYLHFRKSVEEHGGHLSCGNQGYRPAFVELCEKGDVDLFLAVLLNPEYPGWGYMLDNGATTVWERWEKENQATMNSFDHPMFASYDYLFYRYLAGLKIDDMKEGKITISPKIPKDLSFVKASFQSSRGLIQINWEKNALGVSYCFHIPANLSATLSLAGTKFLIEGKKAKPPLTLTSGVYYIQAIA